MVDHRADDRTEFSLFAATEGREAWRPEGWKDRIAEWMSATFRRPEDLASEKTDQNDAARTDGADADMADPSPSARAEDSEAAIEQDLSTATTDKQKQITPLDPPHTEQTATPLASDQSNAPQSAAVTDRHAVDPDSSTIGIWQRLTDNRLPILLTILWIVALGAYGLGYIERVTSGAAGVSAIPTIDVMFFAFSIAGPIGMLWIVVSLINRTEALSMSMQAQSESALALAMTVGNLQESVDNLAEGTTGRIETSLVSLEARTAASVVALDDAIGDALTETRDTIRARAVDIDDRLAATGSAISEVLSARVDILDRALEGASRRLDDAVAECLTVVNKTVRQRSEAFEAALDAQRQEFGKRLETRAVELSRSLQSQAEHLSCKVQDQTDAMMRSQGQVAETMNRTADDLSRSLRDQASAMKRSQTVLTKALETQAGDLSNALQQRTDEIARAQSDLGKRVDENLASSTTRIEAALEKNIGRQEDGLRDANRRYEETLTSMSGRVSRVLDERSRDIDARLRQNQEQLDGALSSTAQTVEGELKSLLDDVRSTLHHMQSSLSANPPATADKLSELLGATAEGFVRPERDALSKSVKRLSDLEEHARTLIDRIDRTSRLNPLMGGDGANADEGIVAKDIVPAQPASGVVALPFAALPKSQPRGVLNWTAVVHALGVGTPAVGVRNIVEIAKADPQVTTLLSLRDTVTRGLAEDDLHLADLVPDHADASLWADFARGARGGDVTMLAGIDDKVALTLTRARMRGDAAFRETVLRFVETYIALLERAVREIGADPRLVEMAETETGRTFILLAPLTGALLPASELFLEAEG